MVSFRKTDFRFFDFGVPKIRYTRKYLASDFKSLAENVVSVDRIEMTFKRKTKYSKFIVLFVVQKWHRYVEATASKL